MLPWNDGQSLESPNLDLTKQNHLTLGEQNTLRCIWNDRIRLVSECATACEAASLLTSEIKSNTALLNDATFRGSAFSNSNNTSNSNGDDIANQTLLCLTDEQNELVAHLKAEKTRYQNLLARLMEVNIWDDGVEGEPLEEQGHGQGSQERQTQKAEENQEPKVLKDNQLDQHDSGHDLLHTAMARLNDKIATMKDVLADMRQIASSRVARKRVNMASVSSGSSNKRKHTVDLVPDASGEQITFASSLLHVSSGSRDHPRTLKEDAVAMRVELERYFHQVTEININADRVDTTADLLEVAQDEMRVDRARSAQESQEAEELVQAEVHAEMTEELAGVTQQNTDLDMQVGEVTETLTSLVLHVDDLEETVKQERDCKNEVQMRVKQLKAQLTSYATLRTKNVAAISDLHATLNNGSEQCMPPSMTPIPSTVASNCIPLPPVYTSQNFSSTLLATIHENVINTASPLLDHTRGEVASIIQETGQDAGRRVLKTLDAVEELAVKNFLGPSTAPSGALAHTSASVKPLVVKKNDCIDRNDAAVITIGMSTSTSPPGRLLPIHLKSSALGPDSPSLSSSLNPQTLPTPVLRAQSAESLRYTPPREDTAISSSLGHSHTPDDLERDTTPHVPLPTRGPPHDTPQPDLNLGRNTNNSTLEAEPSARLDLPPPTGTARELVGSPENPAASQQHNCSFLFNPSLQGIPVRLQLVDVKSRTCRPFAFVRILPATAAECKLSHNDGDATASIRVVEVRDCRKGRHSGTILHFALDTVCFVPPTAKHQTVVCTAPGAGVDPAQKYYILQFDGGEDGQCVLRKDPKPKGSNRKADLISLPTALLAQVAPPMFASNPPAILSAASPVGHVSSVPAISTVSNEVKKLTIRIKPHSQTSAASKPKVHFDHPPPMWLKDDIFAGIRVQLKEQDGDGSILELISVNSSASTVEVQPLLSRSSAPRTRSVPLVDVRHVTVCAPYQTVVVIEGELKGAIMRVGKYDKDECTLYAAQGRRQTWAKHRERIYKTANLAVVLPPRK